MGWHPTSPPLQGPEETLGLLCRGVSLVSGSSLLSTYLFVVKLEAERLPCHDVFSSWRRKRMTSGRGGPTGPGEVPPLPCLWVCWLHRGSYPKLAPSVPECPVSRPGFPFAWKDCWGHLVLPTTSREALSSAPAPLGSVVTPGPASCPRSIRRGPALIRQLSEPRMVIITMRQAEPGEVALLFLLSG